MRNPSPSRRAALATAVAVPAAATIGTAYARSVDHATPSSLSFESLHRGLDDKMHVADGHTTQVLLRWGDGLFSDSPRWTPDGQTAEAQARQFGTDNDFIAFMPLPLGSDSSDHGLLCVNHESAFPQLMFRGVTSREDPNLTKQQVDVQMASHGHSIVEVKFENGAWSPVAGSTYNRRIAPAWTEIEISGPAAGHERLKTSADPTGKRAIGTLANCAGGMTPWHTVLIAEENIHQYFGGNPRGTDEEDNHLRMGITTELYYGWYREYARFNVEHEPH
ncbi:MAG: DUF839 domain-containing protein, partial [Rhodobacteraceae bacterium]|nr:DUF839 domain-containing protein [Paracoccaceae bacterium]